MKRFLKQLLAFGIVLIVSLVGLEAIMYWDKEKLTEENLKAAHSQLSKDYCWVDSISKSKILICGSSTLKYSIDCKLLNQLNKDSLAFVNLAHFSRGPIESFFILKSLDLSQVKEIYLGIDPWIYAKNYYRNKNKILLQDFSLFEILTYAQENENALFFQRYSNYFYPKKLEKSNECETQIPSEFGSATINKTPVNFNEPIYSWFKLNKYGWSTLQFEYLKKIDELCAKHQLKFTLVVPPKRVDFNKDYCLKCQEIHREFTERLNQLNLNAFIMGTFDQIPLKNQEQYFVESYHMNEAGQQLYSELFQQNRSEQPSKISLNYPWILQDCNTFKQYK